ncbi:hypothetical protein G9A89_016290, partial [Geosiphon pyriformis]
EITESEEEQEESEDQKFTYQNLISGNLDIKTPNFQTQQNLNLENLEIETLNFQTHSTNQRTVTTATPITPTTTTAAASTATTTTTSTTKCGSNGLSITINGWNDAKALQAIPYFLQNTANFNNNSINYLANTFTTIKQGKNEAVTTYLGCFHRNLCQIQTIQTDYFTAPQILNQFIRDLCSSILQYICPIHPADLQAAVTNTRDFETAELKANHAQAVNLVMNRSSELNSKLKQLSNSINQKLERYLANNHAIYQPSQQCNNLEITNRPQNQSCLLSSSNQLKSISKSQSSVFNSELPIQSSTISTDLSVNDTTANISTTSLSTTATNNISTTAATNNLSDTSTQMTSENSKLRVTQNWRSMIVVYQPIFSSFNQPSGSQQWSSRTGYTQNLSSQNYLSFLVITENTLFNNPKPNQKQSLTNNIPLATITNNKSLAAIFPFKLEKTTPVSLFSKVILDTKPITAMYTDTKIDGYTIKLILDSRSAGSIITRQLMDQLDCQVDQTATTKTPIDKIDNLPIEVNDIMISIKALVMETTQYQSLVDNDWLSKANATLD